MEKELENKLRLELKLLFNLKKKSMSVVNKI